MIVARHKLEFSRLWKTAATVSLFSQWVCITIQRSRLIFIIPTMFPIFDAVRQKIPRDLDISGELFWAAKTYLPVADLFIDARYAILCTIIAE